MSRVNLGGRREVALDDELAVSVEALSKIYSSVHEDRFRPAVSVYEHLRARRYGARPGANGRVSRDDERDARDEELDDDELEVDEDFPERKRSNVPLHEISFQVRRGEAVGVVGSNPAEPRTLARILCGMATPTEGRVVVRGRVGPSIELAIAITRQETTVRAVAGRLAALSGSGRSDRRHLARSTLQLALGEWSPAADSARPPRELLLRVAAAAAFDPFADVLLVDDLPDFGDPDFPRRCRARLAERLASGAAAVVFAPDSALIEQLCSQVVHLEHGRVVSVGAVTAVGYESPAPVEDSVEAAQQPLASAVPEPQKAPRPPRPPKPPKRPKPPLVAADEHATFVSVAVLGEDDAPRVDLRSGERISVRVAFELAALATTKLTVRFSGAATVDFIDRGTVAAGRYVATLKMPPGALPPGEYDVAVGLVLGDDGRQSKVGRHDAARLRIEADEGNPAAPGEAAPDAEWTLEAVPS